MFPHLFPPPYDVAWPIVFKDVNVARQLTTATALSGSDTSTPCTAAQLVSARTTNVRVARS